MGSALIDEDYRGAVAEVAAHLQGAAQTTSAVDVIANQPDGWHGFYLHDRAIVASLESGLKARSDKGVDGRTVMLVGIDTTTKAIGQRIAKHGGIVILASRNRDAARTLAHDLQCRQVQYEALYSTLHDVLVLCTEETGGTPMAGRPQESGIHPGYLKSGMTVVDLTAELAGSDLLREAKKRGCGVVEPRQILLEHVLQQVKLIAGKEVPREPLQTVLDTVQPPDEE
jgi:shikimate 5-dehydrogenase